MISNCLKSSQGERKNVLKIVLFKMYPFWNIARKLGKDISVSLIKNISILFFSLYIVLMKLSSTFEYRDLHFPSALSVHTYI